jgi:hypothetical protein
MFVSLFPVTTSKRVTSRQVRCSQRPIVQLQNNEWDIDLPDGRRGFATKIVTFMCQQVKVKVKIPCLIKNDAIYTYMASGIIINIDNIIDRICGLVVRGPGSIPSSTRLSEKQWVCNGVHSAS